MSMDTPAAPESNASLSVRDAAALFSAEQKEPQQPEVQAPAAKVETPPEPPEAIQTETVDDAAPEKETPEVELVDVDIDGYKVQVPKDKAEKLEKDRLRQADYTRKTMAAAEERKAAEAESAKAREERQRYAQGLQQANALLAASLQEQQKIDWEALLQQDPQEYLKQKHLAERRQAALRENMQKLQEVGNQDRVEAKRALFATRNAENQALLDKLPDWKDEKKAEVEKQAIAKELIDRGFEPSRIFGEADADGTPKLENPGLMDHRLILLARDAMLYRQTMEKAKAAAKKVENLPQKVERPGGGEVSPMDGRTTAMKQLQKSGSVRDAAAVFDRIFK